MEFCGMSTADLLLALREATRAAELAARLEAEAVHRTPRPARTTRAIAPTAAASTPLHDAAGGGSDCRKLRDVAAHGTRDNVGMPTVGATLIFHGTPVLIDYHPSTGNPTGEVPDDLDRMPRSGGRGAR